MIIIIKKKFERLIFGFNAFKGTYVAIGFVVFFACAGHTIVKFAFFCFSTLLTFEQSVSML